MSRIARLALVENQRRDQAGHVLSKARADLVLHQQALEQAAMSSARPQHGDRGTGAALLAQHSAAQRMVERLVEATQTQRGVVREAEELFVVAQRRADQMHRAAELEATRLALVRTRAEERNLEDTVIAVSTRRMAS